MKILFIGDIIGEPGRKTVKELLPQIIQENQIEFTIANGENLAGGKGITDTVAQEIFDSGVEAITLGNHTWERKEVEKIINDNRIIRPANFPSGVPGKGWGIFSINNEVKICVINLIGRVYMQLADCPFRTVDGILEIINKITNKIIVDFHSEITSEKQAMGWYLNTKVSAVIGTHTHVQTADERILPPGKTAYISDCGMVGPCNGVIGMDREIIIKKYLTGLPIKFNVAKGQCIFNACIIDIDKTTGNAIKITRITNTNVKQY